MYQLQKWQEIKNKTFSEVEKIDSILEAISENTGCKQYKELLFKWYVEKKAKEDIAEEVGYSHPQSVYEMKNKAIRKFAVALFGVVALVAI